MNFVAHKKEDRTELLINHLQLTGMLSEKYGKSFGCEKITKQIGLLHDIGKIADRFQNGVLNGTEMKQDHAIVAGMVYGEKGKEFNCCEWLRERMQLVMSCHHSYLYSCRNDFNVPKLFSVKRNLETVEDIFGNACSVLTKDNNKSVILKDRGEFDKAVDFAKSNELFLNIQDEDYPDFALMSENEKMFFTRIIYSCLVDADYSATQSFCCGIDSTEFLPSKINVDMFRTFLSTYQASKRTNSESLINKMRDQVYFSCGKVFDKESDFYTLTAPTGTGKTLALMNFALSQMEQHHKERVFIILPYLSIIEQNGNEYKKIFGDQNVFVDSSQTLVDENTKLEAERWNYPIIITTSVHFFEMLFSSKASDLRKLHQVANSVVVFDECQTLPSEFINSTVEVLQFLVKYCRASVLFSTATKPSYEYRNHKELREIQKFDCKQLKYISQPLTLSDMQWNATEIIDDVPAIFVDYDSIRKLNVMYDTSNLHCEDLIKKSGASKSAMYVFNTVKHAEEMYDLLTSIYPEESCYLLSSHFCAVDKLNLIKKINNRLKAGEHVYLAATQCIEAGVDFNFEFGAREIAPLESVIQTAGRVNRNGDKDGAFLIFKYHKHGAYDYPSSSYQVASNATEFTLSKRDKINLYDLSLMDDYYKHIYTRTHSYQTDLPDLFNDYQDEDYKSTSDHYRLIKNDLQSFVIVEPFTDYDLDEYNSTIEEVVDNDYSLTKDLMRRLSKYTVSVYHSDKFDMATVGIPLSFAKHKDSQTGWFLLELQGMYTNRGFKKDACI